MARGFLNKFKFSKKLKKIFTPYTARTRCKCSHTDPITQMRRQEQSLPVMKERIPNLNLPMMKQNRQQVPVMKKRKWLLLLQVLDVLVVGEGGTEEQASGG